MVRLSEITSDTQQPEAPLKSPTRLRLSDARRLGTYDIPRVEQVDKGVGANLVEGILKGFSSAPQVVGNVTMAYGSYVRESSEKAEKQGVIFGIKPIATAKVLGQRIFEVGEKITKSNEQYINQRFPEQGNFTFADKFAQGVGQGSVSLAAALGLGVVGGAGAAAVTFGGIAASSGFNKSIEKDKDLKDATRISLALGFVEGGLEFWGVGKFIKLRGGSVKKLIENTLNGLGIEATQEFTQSMSGGVVGKISGIEDRSLFNILQDALFEGAVGGVLGMGGGVAMSLAKRQEVEDALVDSGVDKDEARDTADKLMRDTMEDVVTATETLPEAETGKSNRFASFAQQLSKQEFDPVPATVAEALAPLPQVELSKEEIAQLQIKKREGGVEFEGSKPIPDRKLVEEIVAKKGFKESDRETQLGLLIKGRTAELDTQRVAIEDRMTLLEKEIEDLLGPAQGERLGDRVTKVEGDLYKDYDANISTVYKLPKTNSTDESVVLKKMEEIRKRGQVSTIRIDNGKITDGHHTLEALKRLGFKTVRVDVKHTPNLSIQVPKAGLRPYELGKIIEGKQEELNLLSKELLSVHAQISDVIDSSAEELSREKVTLPGGALETLRGKARNIGARMERARVETIFRNQKAQAEERRTALVNYLRARLPGPENAKLREKYTLRAAKDMTEEKLQKFFSEIETLRETVRAKQLRGRAESILDKMKSKIENGVKKGVFANANIQALADEIIRVASLSAPEAEQELSTVHSQVVKMIEAGEGETEVADNLRYKAELLSTVSGLEQRNADQLENAVQYLSRQLAGFQTGRDIVRELRRAQRDAEERQAVAAIKKITSHPKGNIQKILQSVGKGIKSLYHFSSFHLEEFWRELGINKMVAEPLSRISERTAALQITMDRSIRDAANTVYGVSTKNNREYMKWLTERMSLDKSDDPNTAPYLKSVRLNTGVEKDLKLSRWDVMYWYASAYQKEGEVDPEAYETLTSENELAAIEGDAAKTIVMTGTQEEFDAAVEAKIAELSAKIKGNAIPADVLEEMFGALTEQDRKFAMRMREIFTSFWPLINPVYARATGVNLTHVDSYIPRIKKTASKASVEDMFTEFSMVEAHVTPFPGSVKERRATSTAPFAQVGLMDVYMGFRDVMSHWIATHDITVRMQRYLKNRAIRDAINEATDGVQDKVTGEWKSGAFVGLMDFHLKGIASRGRSDNNIRPPAMDFLRRNLSRAMLSKPRQALVQLTSTFAAIQRIGHVDFFKGTASFWRDPAGSMALLNKALSLHNRYKNISIEMKEVQDLIRLQRTRFRDKLNWVDKYAFFFTQLGDRAAISLGGWAVFKSTYDRTKNLETAYKDFDDYVYTLQQSALREHQTGATVGPNRYLFQFLSAIAQYGRVYYRSWANLVRTPTPDNIKTWARTMVVFHLYIPSAMWYVSQIGLPPPEDEEEEEKRKKKLLAFQLTGPFSGLWIVGILADLAAEAITGQKGYDTGPAVFSELNKTRTAVSSAITKALDEDEDPEEIMSAFFKAEKHVTGLTAGVPAWLNDNIQMLYLHSQGEWDANDTPGLLYGQSVDMMEFSK